MPTNWGLLCRQTVGRWRERFTVAQIEGLEDRPRSGRPARILAPTIDEVVRRTTQEKPAAETHWSTRTLAPVAGVSAATVGRIWRADGLKPHRVKTFKLSNAPRFGEKLGDLVELFLHPAQNAVVISVDEKCQIQALERTQPGLPWKKGRCGTMTGDYKRHGTTTLFAGMNVADGRRGVRSPPEQELLGAMPSLGPSQESYKPSRKSRGRPAQTVLVPAAVPAVSAQRM